MHQYYTRENKNALGDSFLPQKSAKNDQAIPLFRSSLILPFGQDQSCFTAWQFLSLSQKKAAYTSHSQSIVNALNDHQQIVATLGSLFSYLR